MRADTLYGAGGSSHPHVGGFNAQNRTNNEVSAKIKYHGSDRSFTFLAAFLRATI